MNNNLEKFVSNRREEFDVYEPPQNLWEDIEKNIQVKMNRYMLFFKYAAVVIIIFLSGFYTNNVLNNKEKTLSKNDMSSAQMKIIESKYYYQTEINEKFNELKPYFAENPQLENDLMEDFEELDDYCNSLQSELKENLNNQQVVEAMIRSYRMKLNMLESLLYQLKNRNNENKSDIY